MAVEMSRDDDPLLRWFDGRHLRDDLKPMMESYGRLAREVVHSTDPGPERTLALRGLIESKDNAIRALIVTGEAG